MRDSNQLDTHLSDGDLIRYLDRQVPVDERRAMLAHLSDCGACNERLARFQAQAEAVSGVLAGLDEGTAPDELTRARALRAAREAERRGRGARRGIGAPTRAAAAVAVVALVAFTVEPVRAWVGDRWADLTGADETAVPTAAAPARVLERGSLVSFAPAGDVFVLEVEHAQSAGAVTIQVRDVERASAQIVGGADEAILVLPSGLQVANDASSTASYTVTLPSDLRLVQILAGGTPVAILSVEGRTAPWTHSVPLQQPADR